VRFGHDTASNAARPATIGHQTQVLWLSKLLPQFTSTAMSDTATDLGQVATLTLTSAKAIVGKT
jgi:hypothetical protein